MTQLTRQGKETVSVSGHKAAPTWIIAQTNNTSVGSINTKIAVQIGTVRKKGDGRTRSTA